MDSLAFPLCNSIWKNDFISYHQVLKFQSMEYFEECTTEQVPRKIPEKNSILTNC